LPAATPAAGIVALSIAAAPATAPVAPLFAAWSYSLPALTAFDLALHPLAQPAPPRGFLIFEASAGDLNNDGFNDLVVTNSAIGTEVLLGDGEGRFATHFRGAMPPGLSKSIDLDGDGAADFVAATPSPGVRVLYGAADGQIAYGPEARLDFFPVPTAARFLGGERSDVIVSDGASRLYLLRAGEGDQLGAPEPLHQGDGSEVYPATNVLSFGSWGTGAPMDLLLRTPAAPFRFQAILRSPDDPLLAIPGAITAALPDPICFQFLNVDLDGDGITDLQAACGVSNGSVSVYVSMASGRGVSLSFAPWQRVFTTARGTLAGAGKLRGNQAAFVVQPLSGSALTVLVDTVGFPPALRTAALPLGVVGSLRPPSAASTATRRWTSRPSSPAATSGSFSGGTQEGSSPGPSPLRASASRQHLEPLRRTSPSGPAA
jgi:hypothetical protein